MPQEGLGVPVKLLHESLGHVVTVELKTGQLYRGKLAEAEDNLNISLKDITVTGRDGRVSQLDQVYIRGSMVRFFIVPDMLQNAPMFKRVGPNAMRGRGIGTARGRATIMRGACMRYISPMSINSPPLSQLTVRIRTCMTRCGVLIITAARRGRGVPAPRGIRR
ncbi:Sm-like ribonucleoprotein [Pisolithus thermaeus]|nr:Sm-like ribonucleoprotein [Pisolithus croceorrhizus]KAI6166115.1 Sm-like ribonucleoprotein [Pisolithus thermaeus]